MTFHPMLRPGLRLASQPDGSVRVSDVAAGIAIHAPAAVAVVSNPSSSTVSSFDFFFLTGGAGGAASGADVRAWASGVLGWSGFFCTFGLGDLIVRC